MRYLGKIATYAATREDLSHLTVSGRVTHTLTQLAVSLVAIMYL